MLKLILDNFSDEIFDCLHPVDLNIIYQLLPSVLRMYKSKFIDLTNSYPQYMYIQCVYCDNLSRGRERKGKDICNSCLTEIISISIS